MKKFSFIHITGHVTLHITAMSFELALNSLGFIVTHDFEWRCLDKTGEPV